MIKILKDNNRLVIVIENDDDINMDYITKELITKAMLLNVPIQQEKVEGLEPVEKEEVNTKEIINTTKEVVLNNLPVDIINSGDIAGDNYVGKTTLEAIKTGKTICERDKICVDIYCNCNSIQNKELKKYVIKDLKKYLYDRLHDTSPEKIDSITKEEFIMFFNIYEPVIKNELNSIIQQAGFINLENFLNDADLLNIRGAYFTSVTNLMKRLNL